MTDITITDKKMKFESIKSMAPLKREIMLKLWKFLRRKKFNEWYKYTGEFMYFRKSYVVECECRIDNHMMPPVLQYRRFLIEYKQVIIDLDEWKRRGIIE
jgi:hypothetical protein